MLGLLVRYGHLVVSLQHAEFSHARVANKGWWASTGLGEAPRSRYQGGFALPNPPGIVVFI
jgi:hypothetical protein